MHLFVPLKRESIPALNCCSTSRNITTNCSHSKSTTSRSEITKHLRTKSLGRIELYHVDYCSFVQRRPSLSIPGASYERVYDEYLLQNDSPIIPLPLPQALVVLLANMIDHVSKQFPFSIIWESWLYTQKNSLRGKTQKAYGFWLLRWSNGVCNVRITTGLLFYSPKN